MDEAEYKRRLAEIESRANEAANDARKNVLCWFGRPARYRYLADSIRSMASAGAVSAIEAKMLEETEALDKEYYRSLGFNV